MEPTKENKTCGQKAVTYKQTRLPHNNIIPTNYGVQECMISQSASRLADYVGKGDLEKEVRGLPLSWTGSVVELCFCVPWAPKRGTHKILEASCKVDPAAMCE